MKRTMKRMLSLLLAVILLGGTASAGLSVSAAGAGYQNGDVIEFGSYPQSRVTDARTLAELDALEKEWISYGYLSYYEPGDYMRYADVELNGRRYRAVTADAYRPSRVYYTIQDNDRSNPQRSNGIQLQTVYYYAYEPILWVVIDAAAGYLLSRDILAQQDYCSGLPAQNPADGFKYRDNTYAHLLSDWATSDVRAWLNETFLNDAFTAQERQAIRVSLNENQPCQTDGKTYPFETAPTEDSVFLPAKTEIEDYSDASGKSVLYAYVTDYALCQGQEGTVFEPAKRLQGNFLTRTANTDKALVKSLLSKPYPQLSGFNSYMGADDIRMAGTRPAMRVDLSAVSGRLYGGTCGRSMTWELVDGELALRGNGLMTDYASAGACPWDAVRDQIRTVYAWDGVNSICANAFANCENLTEVFLEPSVRTVKKNAFSGCGALERVTVLADTFSANSAFPKNRPAAFVCRTEAVAETLAQAGGAVSLAQAENGILTLTGTVAVSDAAPFARLERLLRYFCEDADTVCFEKLVFKGMSPDALAGRNRRFADPSAADLTLLNLYVCWETLAAEPELFSTDRLKAALQDEACAAFRADPSFGRHIEFGSYPQTEVTDSAVLGALNAQELTWTSYRYYRGERRSGAGEMFAMKPDDFMYYTDVELGGERYRGVRIDAPRPLYTWDYANNSSTVLTYSSQNGNAAVLWFRYEPIVWRILDAQDGLIFSENVLDNQPFENMYRSMVESEYRSSGYPYPAIYAESSVRAWLNETFRLTAFNAQEQAAIRPSALETPGYATRTDLSNYSTDQVFLLSLDEAMDAAYGFSANELADPARSCKNQWTDYAFAQGPVRYEPKTETSYFNWMLRTGQLFDACCTILADGSQRKSETFELSGIRPAMRVDPALLKPRSGSCGKAVQWAFDEEGGVLSLTGTGAMDSLGSFADYGYSVWQDEIRFVAASHGVTAVGAHAFEGCPALEEAILGAGVTKLGASAFADCPKLMNVTVMADTLSAQDAFPQDRADWTLIAPAGNEQASALGQALGVPLVTFSYEDEALSFQGNIIVHDALAYSYLPALVAGYAEAKTVYFERLVFADIEPNTDPGEAYMTEYNGSLALENVTVSLVYIAGDGSREQVTYARMLELLESGDYYAFKLRIDVGDDETMEELITRKLESILPFVPRKVLRIVSKAINFIVKIFKK